MPYSIKYQISYYRKSGGQTTINICDKALDVDNITVLTACADPLEISFEGDINNIYKSTIGSGATIKVMATPLSLEGLFTTDPQKYMVKIYNGDSEESSGANNLIWQGFINTGIYTESYSTPISLKSPITIHCNDGMVLLEDLLYTQTVGGSNYTGYSTVGVVMKNIFDKLALDLLTIKTATDLNYDGHTALFTVLSVNNENYYDEQGIAMTCREVLESVFEGLGLVIKLKGFNIYIIDPISLHTSDTTAKKYDTHPIFGSNESTLGFGGYLDITNKEIAWYETGANRDIIMPFNYIDIKYDPYNFIAKGYDFGEDGNATDPNTYGEYTNNGVVYRVYYDITMKGWVISGIPYFEGFEEISPDQKDKDYVIRRLVGGTGSFSYTFPFSNIQQDDNLMLELNMDVFVNTRHVSNIFDPVATSTAIPSLLMDGIEIKIGDYWYNNTENKWGNHQATNIITIRELDAKIIDAYSVHGTWFRKRKYYASVDTSNISDKWVTVFLQVPLSSANLTAGEVPLLNGSITLKIDKGISFLSPNELTIKNILIKNIDVQIVDLKKKPITNDGINTNSVISSAITMKKSNLSIALTTGTGPYGVSKGAICSSEAEYPGQIITGLSRLDSVEYKTTDLLVQSLMGQYAEQRYKLNGLLNVKDYLMDTIFYLIKDSTYSSTKAFYIVNGTYSDREEKMNVEMIELTNTRGIIV